MKIRKYKKKKQKKKGKKRKKLSLTTLSVLASVNWPSVVTTEPPNHEQPYFSLIKQFL